jgi:hypothetical protein
MPIAKTAQPNAVSAPHAAARGMYALPLLNDFLTVASLCRFDWSKD